MTLNSLITNIQKRDLVPKTENEFLNDVWSGLSHKQKSLSPKYFYDEVGSELFEEMEKVKQIITQIISVLNHSL